MNEQEQRKRNLQLNALCKRLKLLHSVKKIKTWSDLYAFTAIPAGSTPEHLAAPLSYKELVDYLPSLYAKLEQEI